MKWYMFEFKAKFCSPTQTAEDIVQLMEDDINYFEDSYFDYEVTGFDYHGNETFDESPHMLYVEARGRGISYYERVENFREQYGNIMFLQGGKLETNTELIGSDEYESTGWTERDDHI